MTSDTLQYGIVLERIMKRILYFSYMIAVTM
jgi:hypothetical protein